MATSPSIGESNANALDALLRISTERTFNLRRARLTQLQKSLRSFKKALQAAGFLVVKNSIAILVTWEIEH
jgi:hypothetical protein